MRTKHAIVLALFALAGALTFFCRVERHAQAKSINLAAIPTVIGEWRMVSQDTTLGAKEEKFLDDVLVRTYQRPDGKEVMLAIAYGADQRKNFSIHLPEYCYKQSGCTVMPVEQAVMSNSNIKLKRMLAKNPDGRIEAVQYWIVLGSKVVTREFENRLRHFYISLFNAKADGVLVRVSSIAIENNYMKSYEMQKEFISAMNNSLTHKFRKQLFGS